MSFPVNSLFHNVILFLHKKKKRNFDLSQNFKLKSYLVLQNLCYHIEFRYYADAHTHKLLRGPGDTIALYNIYHIHYIVNNYKRKLIYNHTIPFHPDDDDDDLF